ncbi:MAG: SAM-dependent methyltransferase [Candidatus Bathyarchaeota archaeon]|nr:SAM-dependent methyltransferase [Candidatus Bathyarchaeota archaeon]
MRRNKRRIESKSSMTASYMCLTRAASFKDERECYNSPDNIAYELTPSFLRSIIKSRLLFKAFCRRYYAKGSYEYVIARTKYFDNAFEQALMQGFDQIVVFGAGFDSRAIRFNGINKLTRIFEVDAPKTQQEKQMGLKKRSISAPESLVYVPIDFDKEQLAEKMRQAGFASDKKTLFTFEGVTMYLTQSGIEDTFQFISEVSAEGSILVFDHIYSGVLRGENKYFGEEGMADSVAKVGENWQFGLEEGEAEQFVGKFGFSLKDNCNAEQLTERYFKNSKGEIVAKINGTHAIVTAVKTFKERK